MPIGTSWADGSWADPTWASGTWAGSEAALAALATPGKYAVEHASALLDISAAGEAVTFIRAAMAYNTTTGQVTPTSTTIAGYAIQVRGKPQRYAAQGLILATMPTLLFVPSDYGLEAGTDDFVLPSDVGTWSGKGYTVKDVECVAPDGIVIVARLIVSA